MYEEITTIMFSVARSAGAMQPVVHHVELCVRDGVSAFQKLKKYGFRPFATRETPFCKQTAVKLGGVVLVIIERNRDYRKPGSLSSSIRDDDPLTVMCCEDQYEHLVDTVFNVALSVKNVTGITKRIESAGGVVVQPPTTLSEQENGSVQFSIVESCCGNVKHTLINKDGYSGLFLPGFKEVSYIDDPEDSFTVHMLNETVTHVDHVTLACYPGESQRMLSWYENCFGMERFSISSDDDDDEGLILEDGVGLRLRAMEYWMCAESGLIFPSDKNRERTDGGVMLVVVETLPGQTNCNVETFLKEHSGPGVEHIAFNTKNMYDTVQSMKRLKVEFRQPPSAYYDQLKKVEQIRQIGEKFDLLQELGILLDNEVDPSPEKEGEKPKYLMQIFAQPLFLPAKTFFIEVIQRSGARGLGAGNILALVRSIREDERRKAEENSKYHKESVLKCSKQYC